jgi:hypothetical protein
MSHDSSVDAVNKNQAYEILSPIKVTVWEGNSYEDSGVCSIQTIVALAENYHAVNAVAPMVNLALKPVSLRNKVVKDPPSAELP